MKDYEHWHRLKSKINAKTRTVSSFKEREIWFCSLGANIGSEQDGKNQSYERPVIIFKRFNRHLFWGIPLSSKKKWGKHFHELSSQYQSSVALLLQLRLFDAKRLLRKKDQLEDESWNKLIRSIKYLIPREIRH